PEQARAFGFDRQVLSEWVQDAALDQLVCALRLDMADADVAKAITDDPSFKGPGGQFDADRFRSYLQQVGQSEAGYVAEIRREVLRRQVTGTLGADFRIPSAATEAINRYANEQRDADYVVLTRALA